MSLRLFVSQRNHSFFSSSHDNQTGRATVLVSVAAELLSVSAAAACLLSLTVVLILTSPLPSKEVLPVALPVKEMVRAVFSFDAETAVPVLSSLVSKAVLIPSEVTGLLELAVGVLSNVSLSCLPVDKPLMLFCKDVCTLEAGQMFYLMLLDFDLVLVEFFLCAPFSTSDRRSVRDFLFFTRPHLV